MSTSTFLGTKPKALLLGLFITLISTPCFGDNCERDLCAIFSERFCSTLELYMIGTFCGPQD